MLSGARPSLTAELTLSCRAKWLAVISCCILYILPAVRALVNLGVCHLHCESAVLDTDANGLGKHM